MSLFGEFHISSDAFALHDTIREVPEAVVEIERVVASDELLTPYFWVTCDDLSAFETAAENDSAVRDIRRLDDFERSTLFRAEWTENVDAVLYAYTQLDATILEATGQHDEWQLRLRFDDHGGLQQFQEFCNRESVPFRLSELHEVTQPRTGSQYGMTPKQYEALVTAWERNYYASSDVSLADVATELDITSQSLSELLRRGYDSLIEHTLVTTSR